jgi:hypothetical protein
MPGYRRDANFWGPRHQTPSDTESLEQLPMTSRPQSFVELSAALTGVNPVLLHGTGMVQAYLRKIESVVPSRLLERLLGTFAGAGKNSAERCLEGILDDEDLGPVARAITVLWYCGAWTGLPEAWRARNGDVPGDASGVVSSAAYQAGLQWSVVGAHPAGARQQGFGAWSTEPTDLVS